MRRQPFNQSHMANSEMRQLWASVVIPAHNEENALPRLLESVLQQELSQLHLEVIVVVNGSTDRTAATAREYVARFAACGHQLNVVEIPFASKACALNEGDRNVTFFPRLYLDADILLSVDAIRRTVKELTAVSTPRLAAPKIHIADSTNRAARSYGRIWAKPLCPFARAGRGILCCKRSRSAEMVVLPDPNGGGRQVCTPTFRK
jgi:Glycosyl transferase family 2